MIRQTFNIININIMKALIIIAAMLVLVVVLKVLDALTSGRINSVGAKSNSLSRNMPSIDINDPESIKAGIAYYKDLED